MPSIQHEALVEMFRQHPGLAALVLRDQLGVRLPAYQQVRPEPADLNDTTPTERRADAIVTLLDGTGAPALGVVVEIQLRPAEEKRRRWPFYLAKLWMRLGCPVMLLVVCADVATARWCATGIEMGHPGLVLRPLVYGPDQVPVVTDVGQVAGVPELAMLSAMAHGHRPEYVKILDTLQLALAATEQDRAIQYSEIMLAVLPEAARGYWEELMSTGTFAFQSAYARRLRAEAKAEGRAEGWAEGKAEGRAEAEARAVLEVLDARGFQVPTDARTRITSCSDLDQLVRWVRRAAVIQTLDDLFA
jgi:hypothetical protein